MSIVNADGSILARDSSVVGNVDMGTPSVLWNTAKKCFTVGVISLTVSDLFASIVPVRGASMSPTFNPRTNSLLDSLSGITSRRVEGNVLLHS